MPARRLAAGERRCPGKGRGLKGWLHRFGTDRRVGGGGGGCDPGDCPASSATGPSSPAPCSGRSATPCGRPAGWSATRPACAAALTVWPSCGDWPGRWTSGHLRRLCRPGPRARPARLPGRRRGHPPRSADPHREPRRPPAPRPPQALRRAPSQLPDPPGHRRLPDDRHRASAADSPRAASTGRRSAGRERCGSAARVGQGPNFHRSRWWLGSAIP
jgi:hypothetical protein